MAVASDSTPAPVGAATRSRRAVEARIEELIALLDALDGDTDAEPDADGEPYLAGYGPYSHDRELDLDLQEGDEHKWGDSDMEPDAVDGGGDLRGGDLVGADEKAAGERQYEALAYVPPPTRLALPKSGSLNIGNVVPLARVVRL